MHTAHAGAPSWSNYVRCAGKSASQNFTRPTPAAHGDRPEWLRDSPQPLQGLIMSTPNPTNPGKRSFRSLLFNRSTILSFVAGAAVAVAVGVSAQVAALGGWDHG